MTTTQIPGPAGLLHVDDGGAGGLPVVFLHSYSGSSAQWSAQLAHLRPHRRAVALDFRGHGRSEPPAGSDYAVESLAGDVTAVVDALGLRRIVLVGHSLGGATAIAYAGAYPDRVAGLLLAGAPGKIPPERSEQMLAAIQADYDRVMEGYWNQLLADATPETQARVRSEMNHLPREASIQLVKALSDFDPLPGLRAYRGPKWAVVTPHGDTPNDLHRLVPDLPHRVMSGTSHWFQMDKPDEFNRILDEFLADVERTT